jgi:putative ABC transport system permease protein
MPTPWSRAVWMLRRQPAVALALGVAAFLVALPAAAASLFLSASATATLQQQMASSCEWETGAQWQGSLPFASEPDSPPGPVGEALLDARIKAANAAATGVPRLSAPVVTMASGVAVVGPQTRPDQSAMTLVARDGFAGHVDLLSGGTGPGIWFPDGFVAEQGLRVGDRVTVVMEAKPVTLPVAAVYRDLRSVPDQPFWCSLRDLYRGKPLSESPVFPMALLSRGDFVALAQQAGTAVGNWVEMSVDTSGLTTSGAVPVVAGVNRMSTTTAGPGALAGAMFDHNFSGSSTSSLRGMLDRSNLVGSALIGTVVPLAAAGALAGLVIAAAAGSFWVDRRRTELVLLSARGVGPLALTGKALLETFGVVLVGSAAGWVGARYLVGAVGPSPLVTPGAVGISILGAAAAFLVTSAGIAVTSGRRAAKLFDAHPKRVRRWPWELLPLVAAGLTWLLLGNDVDVGAGVVGSVARIPPRLIVVPVLLIVGLAMLVGRFVRWVLARAHSTSMRRPVLFLAWRRLLAVPAAAAVLIGATAVPVALSVYATTVTGSVDRTLHAEAQLVIGTDVVVGLTGGTAIPPELDGQASVVERFDAANIGGTTVNVLGVDPATFARAAFWDPGLPGPSIQEMMSSLAAPGTPVGILAGLPVSGNATLELNGLTKQLAITDTAQLPGKTSGYPLLLVRLDVLDSINPFARHLLWVRGDPAVTVPAISRAGLQVSTVSEAQEVTAAGVYSPISYTFTFLAAVSLLAGAIVMVGLLLYLSARARARRSAYVLLRRMGIGATAHWRALLVEVGGLLLAGFAAGLALAGVVVALTYPGYDVNPTTAPGTLVTWPWPLIGELAAAAVVATVLATVVAQRTVSRARPAEVLRDTR